MWGNLISFRDVKISIMSASQVQRHNYHVLQYLHMAATAWLRVWKDCGLTDKLLMLMLTGMG